MLNLFKNSFRSLKRNKTAITGLTFLTFVSVGGFTVLNSTTNNITNEYNLIAKNGNLHDFTINEKYDIGNAVWKPYQDVTDINGSNTYLGASSGADVETFPVSQQKNDGENYTRAYKYGLDEKQLVKGTLLYSFYENHKNDSQYESILYPTIVISSENSNMYSYTVSSGIPIPTTDLISWDVTHHLWQSTNDASTINSDSVVKADVSEISAQLNNDSSVLFNLALDNDIPTPMNDFLTNNTVLDNVSDKVKIRYFKSLDISNSPDDIFYKIVQANPEDTIDKITTFQNHESLFSQDAFNPVPSYLDSSSPERIPTQTNIVKLCEFNNVIKQYSSVSDAWTDINNKTDKGQKVLAFFQMIHNCDLNDDGQQLSDTTVNDWINTLATSNNESNWKNAFTNYLGIASSYQFTNKQYSYVFKWTKVVAGNAIPVTGYITNWTSYFSIVSPSFIQQHNLKPTTTEKIFNKIKTIKGVSVKNNLVDTINNLSPQDRTNLFIVDKTQQNSLFTDESFKDSWLLNGANTIKMPFIILDSGITPDFIYPIMNFSRIIPNPNSECVVFCNTSAYNRMFDSYRSNTIDSYIVGTFNKGVNNTKTVLNEINAYAKTCMTWPSDINAAYFADDISNHLNASAIRINYIPALVSNVNLISSVLTVAVLILSLFICTIVIRKYIAKSREQIGIMQANGIKKWQIALSLLTFGVIPSIIGGVIAYIVGFFLQLPALSLFSNYWMIPTTITGFNPWIMIVSILVPFVIFSIVSIVTTYITLRQKTVDLMKKGSEYHVNLAARLVKKPLKKFNIIFRFRTSVALNSISKLLILSIMVALSMGSLVFGISNTNKFENAQNMTFNSRNYKYAVDLCTPTLEGGQYIPINAAILGETGFTKTKSEGINWIPNTVWNNNIESSEGDSWNNVYDDSYQKIFGGVDHSQGNYYGIPRTYYAIGPNTIKLQDGFIHGNLQIPSFTDSIAQKGDILYLKNRIMIKNSMNHMLASFGMGANPWNIAVALMPQSNANECNSRTDYIVQQLGEACDWDDTTNNPYYNDYYSASGANYNNLYGRRAGPNIDLFTQSEIITDDNQRIDQKCPYNYTWNEKNVTTTFSIFFPKMNPLFIQFLCNTYTNFIFADDLITPNNKDYQIVYNQVALNDNDETYTYISGKIDNNGDNKKIIGIKNNSSYVNLTDSLGNNLSNKLVYTSDDLRNEKVFPIFVNEFAAHKNNWKVGDHIKFSVDNKTNRLDKVINPDYYSNDPSSSKYDQTIFEFQINGIVSTYENEEYFTNQQVANYILGLRNNLSNKYQLNNTYVSYTNGGQSTPLIDVDSISNITIDDTSTSALLQLDANNANKGYGNVPTDLVMNPITKDGKTAQTVPFGFNGVFSRNNDGGSILNGGISLYSTSGLYPANDSFSSPSFIEILKTGANLQLANKITGINDETITVAFNKWQSSHHLNDWNSFVYLADDFTKKLSKYFGNTSMNMLVTGANDRDGTQKIFTSLSSTIGTIENVVLITTTIMVILIVMLVSIMIIDDSKRLAATLKALGYSDKENILTFLSIYIPVILIGLAIGIPLSFGIVYAFQAIVFHSASILLSASIPWWSFLASFGTIALVLLISASAGYSSLKRDRLVDMIKE